MWKVGGLTQFPGRTGEIRCLFNFLLFTVQSTVTYQVHHIFAERETYYIFLKSQRVKNSRNPLILWEF